MEQIHNENQFNEIVKTEGYIVFVFTTKWCGDCIFIKPFLPEIEEKYKNIKFYEIDRDECMDLGVQLEILGIPSFVCYKDGKECSRFVSSLRKTKEEIESYLTDTLKGGDCNASI